MDYGATYSKERLTGRGYFTAAGQTGTPVAIDLGNVSTFECDFGIKRKEHFANRHGIMSMDRYDAYSSMGSWKITLDEYVTPTHPLFWSGQPNAAVAQTQKANGSGSFMFTFANTMKGAALDIGILGLSDCAITGAVESPDIVHPGDYFVDRANGKLYFPISTTIATGAHTLTYNCPALTYDSATALTSLNKPGTFQLYGEDDSGQGRTAPVGIDIDSVAPARYQWNFPCIISIDKSGTFKPEDYRTSDLIATLTAPMTVLRLQ